MTESVTGEGRVRAVFKVSGRGYAVVIEDGWKGQVFRNGCIIVSGVRFDYLGPDFVSGKGESYLAISVADVAAESIVVGAGVEFYAADCSCSSLRP